MLIIFGTNLDAMTVGIEHCFSKLLEDVDNPFHNVLPLEPRGPSLIPSTTKEQMGSPDMFLKERQTKISKRFRDLEEQSTLTIGAKLMLDMLVLYFAASTYNEVCNLKRVYEEQKEVLWACIKCLSTQCCILRLDYSRSLLDSNSNNQFRGMLLFCRYIEATLGEKLMRFDYVILQTQDNNDDLKMLHRSALNLYSSLLLLLRKVVGRHEEETSEATRSMRTLQVNFSEYKFLRNEHCLLSI